ncbi:MAG: YfhO family protein [Ruminococcus sp.]|nr:YfhO family protein [Ruminococcus sp.]
MNKGTGTRYVPAVSKRKDSEMYLMLFIVSFIGMMAAFIPTMLKNGGIFLYYGDFNSQQMMFYFHANEMVRNGNLAWDWATDLGSNFIGSYSFYLLGSPFFWLTTLIPLSAVKYIMPWMLALKTSVAGITAYAYIRRFVKDKNAAFIGAMLYAFSGFQLYNVFFNHFHDVTAFFPLLLLTFEQLSQDKRHGVFALTVALCASISYFFFVCEVVFVVIYFFLRCLDKEFRMDFTRFGQLIFEAVLGVMISGIILLPAVYDVINNPRVDSRLYGTDMIFYGENVRIPRIIQAFFMMSDMPARINILKSDNARWASLAGYLPMFAMCGVIAYIREKSKDWLSKTVIVCGIMMCVPVLNSVYVALNSSYYARWYFMPILMMCLMTAIVFDEDPMKLKKGYVISSGVGLFFLAIGLLPKMIDGKVTYAQNFQYKEMYYMQLVVTVVLMAIMGVVIYVIPKINGFRGLTAVITSASCIVMMFAGVNFGAIQDGGHQDYIDHAINGRENIDMDKLDSFSDRNHIYADNTFYRIDTSDNVDNWCMFWGLPSMRTFHSVVPSSIMDYYTSLGQTRDVASRMDPEVYAFRSLHSVRYYFKKVNNAQDSATETVENLSGFEYLDRQNMFDIYENKNWIPMGFTYDQYTTADDLNAVIQNNKPNVITEALVLDMKQQRKYSDILTHYEYSDDKVTEEHFAQVCEEKRAHSCYYFKESTHGFDAKINADKDSLLFFSVPYEDGWTATVNGQPAEIEKVNFGFMAVKVNAGENEVKFKYETAGLRTGIMMTVGGFILLLAYLAVLKFVFHSKPEKASAAAEKDVEKASSEAEDTVEEDVSGETEESAEEINEQAEEETEEISGEESGEGEN